MPDQTRIQEDAARVARDWHNAKYYDQAETGMEKQWKGFVWPFLAPHRDHIDFSKTMDFACGRGRNTVKLNAFTEDITLVDVQQSNIEHCRERFADKKEFKYLICDGYSLNELNDSSFTFIYTFDAVVHFDSDVVRAYLKEFHRTLKLGGRAFIHHSNTTDRPGQSHKRNPGWRNFMSNALFAHYSIKEGFFVLKQQEIDWRGDGSLIDGLTLIEKRQ